MKLVTISLKSTREQMVVRIADGDSLCFTAQALQIGAKRVALLVMLDVIDRKIRVE